MKSFHNDWQQCQTTKISLYSNKGGFPGGSVTKNPPANTGDMGLTPHPGKSRMPGSNWTHAPQLLNLYSRAWEAQLLKPARPTEPMPRNKRSQCSEKPARPKEEPPLTATREEPTQQQRPSTHRNKWKKIFLNSKGRVLKHLVSVVPACQH